MASSTEAPVLHNLDDQKLVAAKQNGWNALSASKRARVFGSIWEANRLLKYARYGSLTLTSQLRLAKAITEGSVVNGIAMIV